MDNVPIHKVVRMREAIERHGAILIYLPAYSPDFNPIEQFFAKMESVLRKIAAYTLKGATYSIERLCKTIAACLDGIFRVECTEYFAHWGIGQPKRKML
jgi:transposase